MAAGMEKEGRGSHKKELKGETSITWKFIRCEL